MLKEKLNQLNIVMTRLRSYDKMPDAADIETGTTLLEEVSVELMAMKPDEIANDKLALADFFTSLSPNDQFQIVQKLLLGYNSIILSAHVVAENSVDGQLNPEAMSKAIMDLLKQFIPPTPPPENDSPKAP